MCDFAQFTGLAMPITQKMEDKMAKAIVVDDMFPQFSSLVSSASQAEELFCGLPCECRDRLHEKLKKATVKNWSSTHASWDGKPYQYDNGPWPKQDRFYKFSDGSVVGVIWDYNGHISVRAGK